MGRKGSERAKFISYHLNEGVGDRFRESGRRTWFQLQVGLEKASLVIWGSDRRTLPIRSNSLNCFANKGIAHNISVNKLGSQH